MAEIHPQNRDPFAESLAPVWAGAKDVRDVDLPGLTRFEKVAARQAIVESRAPVARSRDEVLAEYTAERARATAYIAKIDRQFAPPPSRAAVSSAQVDEIIAEEYGVDENGDELYDETA